jgi:hypothetical protein
MRPTYERAEDRNRQRTVMGWFCQSYGCSAKELPPLAAWDFEATLDGDVVAIVEVKCRTNGINAYPTYLISHAKVEAMLAEASARTIAPILLVSWSDARGWVNLADAPHEVADGGRRDRNDPADIERVALIPVEEFKVF